MSDIKVKAEELEDFASQIGKAERECDDALDAINWHFSSMLANFPGVVPGSIHNLEADLKYSIKKYKSKLDDAQQLIKLTAANMKNDEQKMSGKVGEFLLELVGWYDIQRVFSEYDPITGEKLSAGDRVLAVGFLALTFVPPAKAVGVGGKAAVKGVKAGLPSLAKSPEAFMKIRNVLDPKRVQQAFRSVYNEVVKGPIAATKVWFDKVKRGFGDIPIPQIRQEALAGVGVVNKTVKDAFGEAKDLIKRIKSSQVDEVDVKSVNGVEGVAKGTGKNNNEDYFIGTLKGEKVHLKGVKVEEIIYTKRLPDETAKLRREFNSSVRKNFLKEFANDPQRVEYLRTAGLSDADIARMKDGLNPKGWQVHHNLPLDDGGTNDFTNLVLIKNDPYHKAITNEQNSLTKGLLPKQSKTINWPLFEEDIYPSKPFK
ncbi:pre-toxin TG domain-containing protein [Fredinandcohnia onubensis]|uniref:pre-toxin TG domain-containing protein n=1 Tax=Fredinandcohnia onubensis TaxID=1571209 RepID=UPI000C0BBB66|nr:pre-toxin TG domain-containing protein [Fredinandcohnia onubensis]